MKKHGIANSHISDVLSKMGHTDTIVIADYGLPIPDHVLRIDLAYDIGKPGFAEILKAVLADFNAEKITLACEIKENNIPVERQVLELTAGVPAAYVPHEVFKELTKEAKAIIRTGENTPYANIILHSGVNF